MVETDTTTRRGRPRSVEADHAIAEATLSLLSEDGWTGLTMNGVAHRAGVSTATLYRRYSSKEDLVCDAIRTHASRKETGDHGSLEADLRARLHDLVDRFRGDEGRMTKGVIGEVVRNPRLAELFRQSVFAAGRDDLGRMIQRAVDRGEIPPPDDLAVVANLIIGPLFYRLLVSGEPVNRKVVDRLVPLLVAALRAA